MTIVPMNTIFCKLFRLKKPSIQIFDEFISGFLSDRTRSSGRHTELPNLSLNGGYERAFISVDSGKIITVLIKVPCICYQSENLRRKVSETVLPDICIPGSSFTIIFVLRVMMDKFMPGRFYTNNQICMKYGIAMSTLRRWIMLFKQMMPVWNKILDKYMAAISGFYNSVCGRAPKNRTGSCLESFFLPESLAVCLNIIRKYRYSPNPSVSDKVFLSE